MPILDQIWYHAFACHCLDDPPSSWGVMNGGFPSTHWSFVTLAGAEDGDVRRRALAQFLDRYLPALKAYLLASQRLSEHDAEDVLQAFIADKLIEDRLLEHAVKGRGRFRAFILTVLGNYVTSWRRAGRTRRRAPRDQVSLDQVPVDPPSSLPDHTLSFEVAWAQEVVAETVRRVSEDCERNSRPDLWMIFEARVLRPCYHQEEPVPLDELAVRCGLDSPAEVSNRLVTAKRIFARAMRSVVAEYASGESELEAELRELQSILARGGYAPARHQRESGHGQRANEGEGSHADRRT